MSKHIHAELMAQYAADAMGTDKPWERWEARRIGDQVWVGLGAHPAWFNDQEYRRKTITVIPIEPLPVPLVWSTHVEMPHQDGIPLKVYLLLRDKAQLDAWVKFFESMPEGF